MASYMVCTRPSSLIHSGTLRPATTARARPVSLKSVPEMHYESACDGTQYHQDDEDDPPRVRPELATLEVPHVREVPVCARRHHHQRDDRHDVPGGVARPVPLEQGERCSDQGE